MNLSNIRSNLREQKQHQVMFYIAFIDGVMSPSIHCLELSRYATLNSTQTCLQVPNCFQDGRCIYPGKICTKHVFILVAVTVQLTFVLTKTTKTTLCLPTLYKSYLQEVKFASFVITLTVLL